MKVSIIGVTGYSGLELLRLLQGHTAVEIASVHASQSVSQKISDLFPHLKGICELTIEPVQAAAIMAKSDLVFFATPSGLSKKLAAAFVAADFPVIDLSGDFRLPAASYERWYGQSAADPNLQAGFVYGLSEWTDLEGQRFIANPGCYATAVSLSLLPLLAADVAEEEGIVVDAKSGLTGAGKKLAETSHFAHVHANYRTYKPNQHQHIPEILQSLQSVNPRISHLQFSTSLLPINRGIVATAYLRLKEGKTVADISRAFRTAYRTKPFIRLQEGELPDLHQVIGSNYTDIGWIYNPVTGILTVQAVLDNLVKGAAGQAIQNLNLMAGFPETTGLTLAPIYV